MRIAVVNSFFPPRVGGSAHLSNALAERYAAAGHEVVVLTAAYRDAPAYEERDGLRIHRLPAAMMPQSKRLSFSFDIAFTTRPSLGRRIAAILDEFKPDVMHQHGQFFDLTWATGAWAKRAGVPVLLSVHTRLYSPTSAVDLAFRGLDAGLVHPMLRRYRPAFVVMDVLMDEYIGQRYAKADGGREYIPVGVDPDWLLGGDGDVVRERHGLGDRPIIASIGHVIPQRARLPLVEALPALLREVPDLAVVVVGTVYYPKFLERAEELGVRHAILDIGAVPKDHVRDYLAAATVEVHDLEGHGFGTASLESMAAGVPVVAALRADNFPGIELVHGKHLFLVPMTGGRTGAADPQALAETLLPILADPAGTREQVSSAAQELVRANFSLDSVTARHLDVLARMAGHSR